MGCQGGQAVGEKPRIVFVIGGPGCGKGTQCKRIVSNFKYQSFSTGDLLRQYVKDQKAGYEDIENQMKEGKLISSATLMKVLKEYIINSPNKKILVDGYPRNQENIDVWEKEMEIKNLYSDKWVVITSDKTPDLFLSNLLNITKGVWKIVIVERGENNDNKEWDNYIGNNDVVYLSLKDQENLCYQTTKYIDTNSYQRKN